MKYLFTLCLLSLAIAGAAQTKGDNLIIVHGQVFDSVVNKLIDLGFPIENLDNHFRLVTVLEIDQQYHLHVKENGDLLITLVFRDGVFITVGADYGKGLLGGRFRKAAKFAAIFGTPEFAKIKTGTP